MNATANRLGFWSSVMAALSFLIFTACFVAIAATQPLFLWTDLADYVAYRQTYGSHFATLAQVCMLGFGPLYLIILHSLYENTPDERKIFVRIAISLGVAFALATGIHYFVQIGAVRLNLAQGHVESIEHFLQSKPDSAISSVNMLGWTLFLAGRRSLLRPPWRGTGAKRFCAGSFGSTGAAAYWPGWAM